MKLSRLFASLLLVALASRVAAAELTSTEELVGVDKRRDNRSAPAAAQRAAQAQLGRKVAAQVDFDPMLGSPKWIQSREERLTGPGGEGRGVSAQAAARHRNDEHRAVKAFLDEHRDLFGHGPDVLDAAVKTRDDVTPHNGVRTVVWQQRVDDIPVYESVFAAHLGRAGELMDISSLFVPDPIGAANRGTPNRARQLRGPGISAQRAIELAVPVIGEQATNFAGLDASPEGAEQAQRFEVKPLPGVAAARLVWFPLDRDTLRLCWQVELTRRRLNERFRVLVDVQDGAVLLWRKLTVEIGAVTYRVYTNDSPTPMRPGWPTPNSAQPPLTASSLVTISALSTNASPLGWINDGETLLRGNNVDAAPDRDFDDRPDLPRATATVNGSGHRTFDHPILPAQHPTNYTQGAAVQLFYWCNWMHDRLYDIGFTEAKGNFQKDNFGRMPLGTPASDRARAGNDPILADAQDGSGVNNANFTPSGDGSPARIQMYIFTGPTPAHDGDLDAEVILHEYTHGMSDRRVGHGVGISQFQTFGLGEGWSDFFAEAMLTGYEHDLDANYPMGGYASYKLSGLQESYYYGIRRYPYTTATNISPLRFSDIDPLQASTYPGIPRSPIANGNGSEVHRQGEVWCLMLWEVRAALLRRMALTPQNYQASNDFVMRLIGDGMDFAPPNPTFVQARDGILAADRALTDGANAHILWSAFAKRGLGLSASSPDVTTTFGIVAAYDVPQPSGPLITPESVSFDGVAGKTFSPDSQKFRIKNPGAVSMNWSVSANVPWLTLIPTNGTVPLYQEVEVFALTNEFSSLPVGQHIATLLFSNSFGSAPVARTVVVNAFASADPMAVSPSSIYNIDGAVGGPFLPSSRLYSIQAGSPISWFATNVPTWLTLSRTNGFLGSNEAVDVTASVNAAATLLTPNIYSTNFSIINSNTGLKVTLPVVLHVGSNTELVEDFSAHPFDLGYSTLTLRPVGDTYSACITAATNFPTDPSAATALAGLRDDEYRMVTLTNGPIFTGMTMTNLAVAQFFGMPTFSFWIGANGNVTPNPGVNTNFFSLGFQEFFAAVRIAPLYADLNPEAGGRVSWQQLSNRAVVTWENVPEFGNSNLNNFQTEIFFDGTIRITWLKVEAVFPQPIVGLSRGTGLPPGLIQSDLSAVSCSPIAQLLLPAGVREGDGTVQASLALSVASATNMTVALSCDNTNEILIPASIVIPANTVSASFPITIVNDDLLDGEQVATIFAAFPDRPTAAAILVVEDDEFTRVNVRVPATVREGAGVITNAGLIALGDFSEFDFVGTPVDRDVTVHLQAGANSRVTVPPTVVVPAGAWLASFDIVVGDDTFLNGSSPTNREPVTITASVANWDMDYDLLTVEDNEPYQLSISLVPQVTENGGNVAVGGTVSLGGIATVDIPVALTSSAPNTVFGPASVLIAAGSRSNSFPLFVIDNNDTNAFDAVRIIASSPSFISATGLVTVIDDDRPTPPINPSPTNGATYISPLAVLAWGLSPLPKLGAMQFDVYLSTNASPTNLIGTTTNLSLALPFQLNSDTRYYWKVSARRAPFVETSAVWSFTTAPFDHFTIETAPSPQGVGLPFTVSVTARDAFDLVVRNYSGSVTLSNRAPAKSSSTIAITELDTGDSDKIEFQNVSDRDINIAGWQVAVYDWTTWPLPKTVFAIPGPSLCRTGEVFQLRTLLPRFAPGSYPNFTFGTNIFWNNNPSSNQIAVMLIDTLGNVADFVCAGDAVPGQISVPTSIDTNQWRGMAVAANLNATLNYQRIGLNDNNDASDWSVGARNIPTNNPGLVVPFTNFTAVAMDAPIFDTFISGVSTGSVVVFEEARGLILTAHDGLGHEGAGAPFDVLARDDVSIAVSAPATVTVQDPLQCRITITNSGAAEALGVVLTNFLPPTAVFSSAVPSQGACAVSEGAVFCDLGNLAGHTSATVIVTMAATAFGLVTNVAVVGRADVDGYPGNNAGSAVTLCALPQLTILDATNGEPFSATPSVMNIPVRLSVPSAAATSVQFATVDNGAIAGLDYVATNGTVVFPPGSTNQTIAVQILADTLSESNETFSVVVSSPVNAQITRSAAAGNITDNDSNPSISISDISVLESDTSSIGVTLTVTLSTNSGKFVSVSYQTSDGSAVANSDYLPVYGNLVFSPGTTSRTITVNVVPDMLFEPTETFAVVLSTPGNGFITKAQGVCTVFDNDTNLLHHFAFETVPPAALVGVPSNFVGSARDPMGGLVTGFAGPVRLIATDHETTRSVGTNAVPWELPLGAGFHDARLQALYLTNDLGGTGQITALSLDVTNVPGQILSNFTIRTKPYAAVQFPGLAWDSAGWTTNYQADTAILSTGWVTFAFHTPAICSGSNLVVDFSFNNASYSSDGMCRSTLVPGTRALGFRTDSGFGNPLSWSNNVPQAVGASKIPNVRFTLGKPVRVSPNLVTDVVGGFWSAAVSFLDPASNLTLRAVDDAGHVGVFGGLVVTLDTDGDGLPDWWEMANGFDRLAADGAAAADPDGDRVTNMDEYLAGTDPHDPSSQFLILAVTPVTNSVRVTVSTVIGKQYLLESSTNLTSWGVVDGVLKPGTGEPLELVDPAPGLKRFYRVRIP